MAKPFIQAKLNGVVQVKTNLQKFATRSARKLGEALETAGYRVHELVEPLTPIDTGDLRQSRFVASTAGKAGSTITVGFSAEHAARVHESTEVNYVIGQAKFLEIGFKQAAPLIPQWAAKALRGELVKGAGLARLAAADRRALKERHPGLSIASAKSAKAKKILERMNPTRPKKKGRRR